jgi:F-type H+-transporting ATPase subunit b
MLATLAVLAQGAEEKTVNPVLPTGNELLWGGVFFALLLIFMWALCLPPIKKAMRRRDDEMQADREAAERARVEAVQVQRDYDVTLSEARVEAQRIVAEAHQAAEARRAEIIGAADAEVATLRQAAMAEIDQQRSAALSALTGEVNGIATEAASKVVQRQLDPSSHASIVDEFVNQSIGNR